jgi:uncharacterized protein YqgV (UPF0045/DUF77 family)
MSHIVIMKVSIEISLYPLAEEKFKTEIWSFIKRLRVIEGLKVVTNGMSTQVFGDFDLATSQVMAEIKHVHQTLNAAVFICKFIGGDRSEVEAES